MTNPQFLNYKSWMLNWWVLYGPLNSETRNMPYILEVGRGIDRQKAEGKCWAKWAWGTGRVHTTCWLRLRERRTDLSGK